MFLFRNIQTNGNTIMQWLGFFSKLVNDWALKSNYLINISFLFILLQKHLCYPSSTKLIIQNKCVPLKLYMRSNPFEGTSEAQILPVPFRSLVTQVILAPNMAITTKAR